jgi:hypothetical protein
MKFEKLEDLIAIDIDTLKLADTKRLLYRIKSNIKAEVIEEKKIEKALEGQEPLKYKAVSMIGNTTYILSFDPETKEARVDEARFDSRGIHMALYNAENYLSEVIKKQR